MRTSVIQPGDMRVYLAPLQRMTSRLARPEDDAMKIKTSIKAGSPRDAQTGGIPIR